MNIEDAIHMTIFQLADSVNEMDGKLETGMIVSSAAGELEIKGDTFQIQVIITKDKFNWIGDNEVHHYKVIGTIRD